MTKLKLLVLSVCFTFCMYAQAQTSCNGTGQLKLVCLIPFTTSASVGTGAENGAATAAAIDGAIGAQLTQLPLAVSAPGTAVLIVNGNPQVFNNLGPILVDRPDSVGKGNLVLGFSYQQFNFTHLDGISMDSVPFAYGVEFTPSTPPVANQYIAQTQHISFKYNQYVALATYGLPFKTDVTVVVPFARVSIGAGALNAMAYNLNPQGQITSSNSLPNTYTPGFAHGVGDVAINVKHVLWSGGESGKGSLAAGGVLRLPTGDALNYLGSGAYGVNLYGLASYKSKISPHVRVAYQWNTNSVLLNPTGVCSSSTSKCATQLPGGVQFDGGADYGVDSHLTLSADVLATQSANTSSLQTSQVPLYTAQSPHSNPQNLNTVVTTTNTYNTANLSAGFKWKPFRRKVNLILYGNVLIPLNDVGLRPDPSPSGGISYSFPIFK